MNSNLVFVGVDPGQQGAIAFVTSDRSLLSTHMLPMLDKRVDIWALKNIIDEARQDRIVGLCMIEQAIVLPKQGSVSGFSMGANYGRLMTSIEFFGLPFEEIRPAVWKKRFFGSVKYEKNAIKQVAVMRARHLFPELAPKLLLSKDGLSEALLIAETARRQFYGERHAPDPSASNTPSAPGVSCTNKDEREPVTDEEE